MKAEITLKNKAKFFALYWGQKILKDGVVKYYYTVSGGPLSLLKSSYQLHLKPLSSITEEDAIAAGISKAKLSRYKMFPYLLSPFMIDYLRSKGYALPYLGLSVEEMIEAGWIKLQEGGQNAND